MESMWNVKRAQHHDDNFVNHNHTNCYGLYQLILFLFQIASYLNHR